MTLRVSDRTVRRWVANGTLAAIKIGGVRRYRAAHIEALIHPANDASPARAPMSPDPSDAQPVASNADAPAHPRSPGHFMLTSDEPAANGLAGMEAARARPRAEE